MNPKQIYLSLSAMLAVTSAAYGQNPNKIVKTEHFDSAASAAANGWFEQGCRANGNDFGFSLTAVAGGTIGEVAGVNQRQSLRAAYGDVFSTSAGVLTLNDTLTATGRIATAGGVGNAGNFIGHYNSQRIGTSTGGDQIGLLFSSPTATSARMDIRYEFADNSGTDANLGWFNIIAGTSYTFDYIWDPSAGTSGRMTINVYEPDGTVHTGTHDMSATDRAKGAKFDAFGRTTRSLGNNTFFMTNYLDDISYTALPGTPCQIRDATPSLTLVQGQSGQFITITIPGTLNGSSPVSVDLVSTNPSVAVAPGMASGKLTLTFPAGGNYSTNLPVSAITLGTTLFYITNATAGCLSNTFISTLVTVGCSQITMSPNADVFLPAQAGKTLAVSFPSSLNASSPVTVDLVSTVPSVAVASGMVGGKLTLNFPAGTTNRQDVTLESRSPGTTVLYLTNSSSAFCSAVTNAQGFAVLTVAQPGITATKQEPFDTTNSAYADGWREFLSRTNSNGLVLDYGFSDTANAGGPNGEAGGSIIRTGVRNYYADRTVGTKLTLNDYISASGNLIIKQPATNATWHIAHFNSADTAANGGRNILGISIANGDTSIASPRLQAALGLANAGGNPTTETTGQGRLFLDDLTSWSYAYDPTAGPTGDGQLIVTYTSFQTTFNVTIALTAAQRATGATFDSFGILSRGSGGAVTNDQMIAYIDSLTYTVGGSVNVQNIETLPGNQLRITFASAGTAHKVQQSSSVSPTSWSDVSGVTFTGPSGPSSLNWTATFANPGTSSKVYRIVANPSP